MNADPLDRLLGDLNEQLARYVAFAKSAPSDDDLLDAVEPVRDASAALTEEIAERTGHRISLHYVFDEDEDDEDVTALDAPAVHITVEEVLRIVDHDKLLAAAGSPTSEDEPGDSPAVRAINALLGDGTALQDLVFNADRFGLEPVEGATSVELIDLSD